METALGFTFKYSVSECELHVRVCCRQSQGGLTHDRSTPQAQTCIHLPHFPRAQRRSKHGSLKQLTCNECAPNSYQALSL